MKDFITYEQALALKSIGFDEPCFGFYERNNELIIHECEITDFHFDSLQCIAPTFSQSFRFFREKYHLIGGVEYIGGATPLTTWWDIYVVGHFNTDASKMTMKYQPYEEAELACLDKLIELAKNTQQ